MDAPEWKFTWGESEGWPDSPWPDYPEIPFDFDEIDFQPILARAAEIVGLLQSCIKHEGEKWDGTSPTGTFADRRLTTATQEAEALRAVLFEAHLVAPEFEVTAADVTADEGFRPVSGRAAAGTMPRAKRMRLRTARPALAVQSAVLLAEAVCRLFNQGHVPSVCGGPAMLAGDSLTRLETAIDAMRHWFPPSPASGSSAIADVDNKPAGAGEQSGGAAGRVAAADGPTLPASGVQPSLEARAMALLIDHPDWNETQIAGAADCARSSLYRLPKYRAARKLIKEQGRAAMPKGSKPLDGPMDAWTEEADDSNS